LIFYHAGLYALRFPSGAPTAGHHHAIEVQVSSSGTNTKLFT
jgi:hypothetical protein